MRPWLQTLQHPHDTVGHATAGQHVDVGAPRSTPPPPTRQGAEALHDGSHDLQGWRHERLHRGVRAAHNVRQRPTQGPAQLQAWAAAGGSRLWRSCIIAGCRRLHRSGARGCQRRAGGKLRCAGAASVVQVASSLRGGCISTAGGSHVWHLLRIHVRHHDGQTPQGAMHCAWAQAQAAAFSRAVMQGAPWSSDGGHMTVRPGRRRGAGCWCAAGPHPPKCGSWRAVMAPIRPSTS
jgi:hypothetical protein